MNTFEKQPVASSFGSVPLVYSTSTQNHSFTPNTYHNNNAELRDASLFGHSMDSSAFTFNNNLTGAQLIRSGMHSSTGNKFGGDFSLKFNPSNSTSNLNPGFSTIEQQASRYVKTEKKQITEVVPPSHQILQNQHNYSFANNRSSLRSFEDNKFSPPPRGNSPISQFKQSPTIYHYAEGSGYQNVQVPTNSYTYSPQPDFGNRNSGNFPLQRFDTFGANPQFNRQTPNFTSSNFNYKKIADRISIPELSPPISSFPSTNFSPSLHIDSIPQVSPTLQSKLLNRELTQLKSDDSFKTTVINQDGVQHFPVKFDSHFRDQKDFSGFCGCKGKRIVFDAAEKTPFC